MKQLYFLLLFFAFSLLISTESKAQMSVSDDPDYMGDFDKPNPPEIDNISGKKDTSTFSYGFYFQAVFSPVENGEESDDNSDENDHYSETVRQIESVAINEATLSVYPNPASDLLYINLGVASNVNVDLVNIIGSRVYHNEGEFSGLSIDISAYEPGIYFLILSTRDQKVTRKIKIVH